MAKSTMKKTGRKATILRKQAPTDIAEMRKGSKTRKTARGRKRSSR